MKERLTAIFRTKTRDEWCDLLEGTDVCFGPILTMTEAAEHPHIKERGTVVNYHDILQPAPAPRFSRTEAEIQGPAVPPGHDTDAVLMSFGFSSDEIASLTESGAVKQKST